MRSVLFGCLALLTALLLLGCGSKPSGGGTGGDTEKPQGTIKNEAPGVSKVDLLKGPKGEEITRVEQGKEQMSGFKDKQGKIVRHGPYVLFYDQVGGKKKVQGECYDGQWHGKLTGWYEDGSLWVVNQSVPCQPFDIDFGIAPAAIPKRCTELATEVLSEPFAHSVIRLACR